MTRLLRRCFAGSGTKWPSDTDKESDGLSNSTSKHWSMLMSFLGVYTRRKEVVVSDSEYEDSEDEDDSISQSKASLQTGANLILRVQSLKYTQRETDQFNQEYVHCRPGDAQYKNGSATQNAKYTQKETDQSSQELLQRKSNISPRKNGSASPRKQGRESPRRGERTSSQPKSNFRLNNFLQQPSTVYVDMSDVEKQLQCSRTEIPCEFFACLHRLPTPTEQMQTKLNRKMDGKQGKKLGNGQKPVLDSPDSSIGDFDMTKPDVERTCVVRVIVLDRRRKLCSDQYSVIVRRILEEQPLLKHHVIIPDMLRRYLNLSAFSRVWMQVIKGVSKRDDMGKASAFSLYPLGNVVSSSFYHVNCLGFLHLYKGLYTGTFPPFNSCKIVLFPQCLKVTSGFSFLFL